MIAPAEFVIRPSGRIEVMLGQHLVGAIEPWHGAPKIEAYFWITLPVDGGASPKCPATSVALARRLILLRLAHWFEAAGPFFHAVGETLAMQSEEERSALEAPSLFPRKARAPAR
jgi:hypothetical protein